MRSGENVRVRMVTHPSTRTRRCLDRPTRLIHLTFPLHGVAYSRGHGPPVLAPQPRRAHGTTRPVRQAASRTSRGPPRIPGQHALEDRQIPGRHPDDRTDRPTLRRRPHPTLRPAVHPRRPPRLHTVEVGAHPDPGAAHRNERGSALRVELDSGTTCNLARLERAGREASWISRIPKASSRARCRARSCCSQEHRSRRRSWSQSMTVATSTSGGNGASIVLPCPGGESDFQARPQQQGFYDIRKQYVNTLKGGVCTSTVGGSNENNANRDRFSRH